MSDPRFARLADVLVNYSVRVRKGDLVKITGSAVCEPLFVEVYKATLRAGGNPYIHMVSDEAADEFLRLAAICLIPLCLGNKGLVTNHSWSMACQHNQIVK